MKFDRAYFDTYYRNYEMQNPPRKLDFYRRLVEKAAEGVIRPRILDMGCAFGLFLSRLDSSWERLGFDASDYAIESARERFPQVHFAVSIAGNFPFHGPFDVIAALDVLEHIPALDDTMAWIAGNLRPGGSLVFVVPVYDGPTGPIIRALDRDPTHIHRKSRSFWLGLSPGEFTLEDWWGMYRYLLPGGFYLHVVSRRWRRFTPAIACLFKRKGDGA